MEISFYSFPESRFPLGGAGEKHLLLVLHQSVPGNLAPGVVGKMGQVNAPGRKVDAHLLLILPGLLDEFSLDLRLSLHQLFQSQNKIASVRYCLDIALRHQLVIGHLGGGAADL